MKKVFIFIVMSLSVCLMSAQNKSRYALSKDIEDLQTTIDSLQRQIVKMSNDYGKLYDTQIVLANRMIEMREDYRNSLDNANTYISWVIGLVTLIVAAFGVGVPLWSNHRTNKQSKKSINKAERLWNH